MCDFFIVIDQSPRKMTNVLLKDHGINDTKSINDRIYINDIVVLDYLEIAREMCLSMTHGLGDLT